MDPIETRIQTIEDRNASVERALIPTAGYLLSTLSLPVIKRWWASRRA